jgi:uncharacterized SAM-binding protein YcdF (DUF218 family)
VSGVDDAREVIVVLGGGLRPDGSPDPATTRRAEAGAALALTRPGAAVIASGQGPLPSETVHEAIRVRARGTEAAHVARVLRRRGVGPERVFLEDESMDTIGNAVFVAARYLRGLGERPLTLVSSSFHLDRARWLFGRALPGWAIATHPAPAGPEDAARAALEPEFRANNERMIEGVADGDLAGLFERLVARWPEYGPYASRVR